ncbi:outer membrane lipoprotein-sorting protein [Sulfurimonas sp. SWIR-19]|uniref:outer membrane lipoprotein-sorting protein n=1 Tax=Sulfurimonas sp. SWIR-19 TaxID=2878390 RepID=UPI001CF2FA13|nr:outer membrane lipoprotein-sorting protein [Sulfurimonas sp. SWIR-19]UCN01179.1 outer membrane lipoprotein-sorting protein [Sulfurimonas sp. SWIR-19]
MLKTLFFLLISSALFAISNQEVANRCEAVMNGFEDSSSTMKMTLINANNQKRERHMKMIILEKASGNKSLMTFLSPADVKGTKFLNYEHINKDDDQWLYLPALKRVKRIASKNKSGSFMGSEFSYEDLSSFSAKKYTFTGQAKEEILNGKKYYVGKRVPVSKNSGYTKQISWVNAKTFLIKKVDYYDRKHELLKTAYFDDYKKIKGVWRVRKMTMTNHQNAKKTILIWEDEKIKIGLKERNFHKRVLKK